jgi:hypothetical protein
MERASAAGFDSSGGRFSLQERWDVKDGNFLEIKTGSTRDYTIISLTKHKFVIQDKRCTVP